MYGFPHHYGLQHAFPQPPPPPGHRQLQSLDVQLDIRQQPKEALVTTDGKEKARKPVDPPPIVQLKVHQQADPSQHFLQSPYLFMTCSLVSSRDEVPVKDSHNRSSLAGCLVSSLHRLKDTNNQDGGFFVFGDVSVKVVGTHKLKFSLFDLHKDSGEVMFLAAVTSTDFKVVQQKDFRGLDESTYLSRAFSDQGVRLRLRKEPRAFGGQKRAFNSYAGIPSNQESHSQSHDGGSFDQYGHDEPVSPGSGSKRTRYTNDYDQNSQQYTDRAGQYNSQASSLAVRPPSAGGYSPVYGSSELQSPAGAFSRSDFSFRQPITTTYPYGAMTATASSHTSAMYNPMQQNHGYDQQTPYQSNHSLNNYHLSSNNIQPGLGDARDAAATGLASLSVQQQPVHLPGQSAQMLDHDYPIYSSSSTMPPLTGTASGYDSDPALLGISRPKGRYQESVDNQVQQLKAKEDGGADLHYGSANYFEHEHQLVQSQQPHEATQT